MADLLGESRNRDGVDHALFGERTADSSAPHIDAVGVGHKQPDVLSSKRTPHALHRERKVSGDDHWGIFVGSSN